MTAGVSARIRVHPWESVFIRVCLCVFCVLCGYSFFLPLAREPGPREAAIDPGFKASGPTQGNAFGHKERKRRKGRITRIRAHALDLFTLSPVARLVLRKGAWGKKPCGE